MDADILNEYVEMIKNKLYVLNFESALASAEKLMANYPKNSCAHYFVGVCNFALERYDNAISNYIKAISLDVGNAKAYFNLGVAYYLLNDFDNALINIGKAMIIFSKKKELDNRKRCYDALNFIQMERKTFV